MSRHLDSNSVRFNSLCWLSATSRLPKLLAISLHIIGLQCDKSRNIVNSVGNLFFNVMWWTEVNRCLSSPSHGNSTPITREIFCALIPLMKDLTIFNSLNKILWKLRQSGLYNSLHNIVITWNGIGLQKRFSPFCEIICDLSSRDYRWPFALFQGHIVE